MKEFNVIYKNGKSELISCAGKTELIKIVAADDESKFKDLVDRIIWSTPSMHYVEDVKTGEVNSQITSADVNPYGWRDN